MKRSIIVLLVTLVVNTLSAQQNQDLENQVNVLFGVGQILSGGFNIEGNVAYKRLFVDYSHGVSLDFPNDLLEDGADKDQLLAVHIPWTTGLGIGYRFNNWLNVRAEPKLHKFEILYEGDAVSDENIIFDYTTFTLGLGLYANLKPFKNQDNFLKGIMISPNVRWWPNISSSLDDDQINYFNERTNQTEIHEARNIGISNTPFFINVSVGYSFGFAK